MSRITSIAELRGILAEPRATTKAKLLVTLRSPPSLPQGRVEVLTKDRRLRQGRQAEQVDREGADGAERNALDGYLSGRFRLDLFIA